MVADIDRHLLLVFQHLFQGLLVEGFGFIEIFLQQGKQHRVEHNRDDRPGQHQVLPGLRQQVKRHPQAGENKGKFTNLRQAGGNRQCGTRRVAKHTHEEKGGCGFTKDNDRQRRQHRQRLLDQHHWVKQHADGDKEQHRKGVAQRQGVMGGAVAQLGFIKHHAGKEGAEGEGDIKQLHGAEGDAQRQGQYRQGEQLARAGGRAARHDPRHQPTADQHHDGDKGHHFANGDPEVEGEGSEADVAFLRHTGHCRQQDQRQDHHQVFHNQPADGDLPALTVNQLSFLQGAQQHHGTGGGETQAKDDAGHQRPAKGGGERHTQQRRHSYLGDGPGNGDRLYRHQILEGKMQPDAEHQQDHAEFRQFRSQFGVSNKARGERSGQHAR